MSMQIGGITFDSVDPRKLAEFWTAVLDYEIGIDDDSFIALVPRGSEPGKAAYVGLHKVEEPTPGKNRVHIDFHTDDREAEVERLVGLGATIVDEHTIPGLTWNILADPEGNVFCVGQHEH